MIPPYQAATEETRRQAAAPLKTALSVGSAIAGGTAIAGRVMPFLNKFVPLDLMKKGLSKVSPGIGGFIDSAVNAGYSLEDVRNFMQEKFSPSQEQEEVSQSAKENRNVIEQYSPELHQFLDQEIKKGRSVLEAGAIAQNNKKFTDVIKKLSKDHKTPWSNILESVYGSQQAPQIQQSQQPQQSQSGGIDPQVAQILQQGKQLLQNFRGSRG
jgi:DNA-binding transcriptional MerR regulator